MFGPRSTITVYTRSPAVQARIERQMAAVCRITLRTGTGYSSVRHWAVAVKRR